MPNRLARRFVATLVGVSGVMFALAAFAAGPASAHDVTSITASCDTVTVHFSDFPEAGVSVHIAAAVQGHGSASTDVFVKNTTYTAPLNISAATADMFGATANVDVDVTWTFEGPQHVHQTLSLTCGEATTTTTQATTTTMPTTTTAPTTSTTVGAVGATTTTTEASVVVGGNTTSTTSGGAVVGATAGGTTGVLGETAVASPAGTSGTGSSLPFTGSASAPLALTGLTALVAGAGVWATQRRKSHIA